MSKKSFFFIGLFSSILHLGMSSSNCSSALLMYCGLVTRMVCISVIAVAMLLISPHWERNSALKWAKVSNGASGCAAKAFPKELVLHPLAFPVHLNKVKIIFVFLSGNLVALTRRYALHAVMNPCGFYLIPVNSSRVGSLIEFLVPLLIVMDGGGEGFGGGGGCLGGEGGGGVGSFNGSCSSFSPLGVMTSGVRSVSGAVSK